MPLSRLLTVLLILIFQCRLEARAESAPEKSPAPEIVQLRPELPKRFGLDQAIQLAKLNYPSIRESRARELAARESVHLEKLTQYMPKLDMLWQGLTSTRNNISGTLLGTHEIIPTISGAVRPGTSMISRWGSSAGAFFAWEPIDFGLHKAEINVAKSLYDQARWSTAVTELDVQVGATASFIGALVAEQEVIANQATVDRLQVFYDTVSALVSKELRAGVDKSLAGAALLQSRNVLILSQERARIARASLAESLGIAGTPVEIEPGPLLSMPGEFKRDLLPGLESHPLALQRQAEIQTVLSRYHALTRTYYPHFQILGAIWGRGSSYDEGGYANRNGLLLTVPDYGIGLNVIFRSLDIFSINSKKRIQRHNEQLERARYDLVMQTLKFQDEKSRALIEGSLKIAANTPLQLAAAQEAELRARTRYRVALANVVEVAEAEQLLAQSQIADAVARADVWRALLVASAAHGTIKPFLSLVSSAEVKGK